MPAGAARFLCVPWQLQALTLAPPCSLHPHTHTPSSPCCQGLDFDKTGGLMGGALQRLDGLLKAGRQGHMCYLIGFVLTVFLLLWWVMSKR